MHLGLPKTLIPTFGTFNIARTYTLIAEATIECGEETFKASFDVQPQIIPYHKYDDDHSPGADVMHPFPHKNPNFGELPTWEESVAFGGLAPLIENDEADPPPPQYA